VWICPAATGTTWAVVGVVLDDSGAGGLPFRIVDHIVGASHQNQE
jgi:hypothetical protein